MKATVVRTAKITLFCPMSVVPCSCMLSTCHLLCLIAYANRLFNLDFVIYILLYKEVAIALKINIVYSKEILLSIHENVKVLCYPDHFSIGVYLWSHHEKLVIVDYRVDFIGGLDLCFGWYDTLSQSKVSALYLLSNGSNFMVFGLLSWELRVSKDICVRSYVFWDMVCNKRTSDIRTIFTCVEQLTCLERVYKGKVGNVYVQFREEKHVAAVVQLEGFIEVSYHISFIV
ncbi:hypothetical protein IFM89_008622 [Coptis chinensis]|uniref:phospholipase D n=1 Tax=Coptis chinensis TaxID=261450 RepID=A0A835HLB2_9MAGN|nr:hypothetical protein IFM89_008622 [Coptis chinensis]